MTELQNYVLEMIGKKKIDKALVQKVKDFIVTYKSFVNRHKKDETWFTKNVGICGTKLR